MAQTNVTPPPLGSPGEPGRTRFTPGGNGACRDEAMLCECCEKAEMYRMHAVWRCPECGFKTDCCGW
ncbi:MAG: hypothetical protein HYX77_09195 [Acidobacteria bacterium]|nr:hypothetical protein [Acidobacteriota bacterium]